MVKTKPFLKLSPLPDGCFNIYWKGRCVGETQAWENLKALQADRIFSIGSGPSIKDQQFTAIKKNEAVLVNGAIQLAVDKLIEQPLIVMIEDARFIYERHSMLFQLPQGTKLALVDSALQALGAVAGAEGLKHFSIYLMHGFETHHGKPRRHYHEAPADSYKVSENAKLSLDMTQGRYGCGTIMYSGIQLAFYLRVKELYLVGFDLTNFDQPRFYEHASNTAWTGLANAYDNRILPAMQLVKEVAEERGMQVNNCSHTSILPRDIFPFSSMLMNQHWNGEYSGLDRH